MKQTLEFCEVRQSDEAAVDALAELASRIWHEYFSALLPVEQIDYMVDLFQSKRAITRQLSEGYRYFVGYLDGSAVAYCGVLPRPNDGILFLSKLYVAGGLRGKGIGGKALAFIKELAREAGLSAVELTCNKYNKGSLDFYAAKGFTIIDSTVKDIGGGYAMDDYVMRLEL
jgi:GNAT superfamily N-acetyltransferase